MKAITSRSTSSTSSHLLGSRNARPNVSVRFWNKSAEAKSEVKISGIRYDANMQRWVKDDRIGEVQDLTCKPLTGVEYTIWPVCWQVLSQKGLKCVTPEEAFKLTSKGWKIVDVRIAGDFDKQAAAGAISLPMYQTVEGEGQWDKVKVGRHADAFTYLF